MVREKSSGTEKCIMLLWGLLLLTMLCFPRMMPSVKVAILLLEILLCFIHKHTLQISKYMVLFLALQIVFVLLKILVGRLNENAREALISSFRVDLVYTVLLVILFFHITGYQSFTKTTVTCIALANIYIGLYNIILVLASYAHLNVSFLMKLDATAAVGIHTGYSHVVSTNLSMSVITFPLSLFLIKCELGYGKKMNLLAALLCGFAMILSGRRILWLILGIVVLVYTFSVSKRPAVLLRRILLAMVAVAMIIVFAQVSGIFNFAGVYDRFIGAFGKGQNADTERTIQIGYLMDGFRQRPILGYGAGAVVNGFARSEATPWVFEMTYHVILFQSGIVGAILFAASVVMLFLEIRRIKKAAPQFYKGCFVTLVMALAANATNPYYGSSFDFALFLFLPTVLAMGCHRMTEDGAEICPEETIN